MFKPRLRRLDRLYTECPVYFITACASARRHLLDNREVHECFVNFARQASKLSVLVGRYVLMPDHLHLFAALAPASPRLPAWVKALKGALSKSLRDRGVPGPYWQKGFFDHVMRSEESYKEKWAYVQQNPMRGGLVKKAEDWPYQGEIHSLDVRSL